MPAETIARHDPEWGARLLGDKAYGMAFDNSKLRTVVPDFEATIPFTEGAEEIIAWFDADPARQSVDEQLDRTMSRIITDWRRAFPA